MSAPDIDPDKQARQHRGPLRGMFAVVLWALVLLGGLAIWAFTRGGDPGETEGGPTANDFATDDGQQSEVEPDPSAVTVPAETVEAPEVGAGSPPDTDPGESLTAEPLEPADGTAEGTPEAGAESE